MCLALDLYCLIVLIDHEPNKQKTHSCGVCIPVEIDDKKISKYQYINKIISDSYKSVMKATRQGKVLKSN